MSYCTQCGREETHGHCICLATNPIPKWHVWIIYAIIIMAPVITLTFIKQDASIWDINYLFYGGLVLSGILILITIADAVIKKPYLALFFGCHQSSARSLKIGSYILPLCARCTGIYIGTLLFPLVMIFDRIPIYVYIVLGIPMILDGLMQRFKKIPSTNPRRFVTGFLFGGMLITMFTLYQVLIIWLVESLFTWI